MQGRTIAVIGGGAAGYFAAIRCGECAPGVSVTLYEATTHLLAKVRVSGGGRCNVTHTCFDPRELVRHYPRGGRELLGPLHRFGPTETVAWFAERGVELKCEDDGRMFPVTDDSATIVNCLQRAATHAGVRVVTGRGVVAITREDTGSFLLGFVDGNSARADRVLLATGGNRGSAGIRIAASLGHTIEPQVPSLFTFHVDDERLRGLEGLSVKQVATSIVGTKLRATGPALITHWGLSGPAILRLSAWGARELHARAYAFRLVLDWIAPLGADEATRVLASERTTHARRQVAGHSAFGLPLRLWERLVVAAGLSGAQTWSGVSNTALQALVAQLTAGEFAVVGKSMNKEEFVTCGGVRLREVDFRTMESRLCPGLFFAGEILDIDGITGGFNFQAAWTTGWLAGGAMAT